MPRYLSGQKEHEVELQFTSSMLSYPDRLHNIEDSVGADGEKIPDYQSEVSGDDDRRSLSVSGKLSFHCAAASGFCVEIEASKSFCFKVYFVIKL